MAMKDTTGGFVSIFPVPGDLEQVRVDGPMTINQVLAQTKKQLNPAEFEIRVQNQPADGNTVVNPGEQVTLLQRVQGNSKDSALGSTDTERTLGAAGKPSPASPASSASAPAGGSITVLPVPGDLELIQVDGPISITDLLARTKGQFNAAEFEVRVDNVKQDGDVTVRPGQQVTLLQRVQGN